MYGIFLTTALLFVAITLVFLILTLLRQPRKIASDEETEASFLTDQIDQIDSDVKMQLIKMSDAELTRTILSRKILKILNLDKESNKFTSAPSITTVGLILAIGFFIPIGATVIYNSVGSINLLTKKMSNQSQLLPQEIVEEAVSDQANANGNENLTIENQKLLELIEKLKKVLTSRPDDLDGHLLLVENSVRIGDYKTAHQAQFRVLNILGNNANSKDFSTYVELCVLAASGYVSYEAANALEKALKIDPSNAQAKYFRSRQLTQEANYALAYKIWANLFAKEGKDSKWVALLIDEILYRTNNDDDQINPKNQYVLKTENQKLILPVLEAWEERLVNIGGSITDWRNLIVTYHSLGLTSEAEIKVIKAVKLLSLDGNEIEELRGF